MIVYLNNSNADYFGLFTGLSLVFLFFGFVYNVHKSNGVPAYQLTGVFFITLFFILAGARLCAIEPAQWKTFFHSGIFPASNRLTVIGALLFGTFGIMAGKKLFGLKFPVMDMIAIPALIAMCIQRLGCLFAGCCHGTATGLPFGVAYGHMTPAHYNFYKRELIPDLTGYTPALHPSPLYLLIGCGLAAIFLWRISRLFKVPGNLFLSAIAFFLLVRFVIEFTRDPLTNGSAGAVYGGLKIAQWIFLLAATGMLLAVFIREKNKIARKALPKPACYPDRFPPYIIVFSLFGLSQFLPSFFNITEKHIFILFFSLFLFFRITHILTPCSGGVIKRTGSLAVVVIFILLMPVRAQITPQHDGKNRQAYGEFYNGFGLNNFSHYHQDGTYFPPVPYATNYGCSSMDSLPERYVYPRKYPSNDRLQCWIRLLPPLFRQ